MMVCTRLAADAEALGESGVVKGVCLSAIISSSAEYVIASGSPCKNGSGGAGTTYREDFYCSSPHMSVTRLFSLRYLPGISLSKIGSVSLVHPVV